jgi:hypothetical protein
MAGKVIPRGRAPARRGLDWTVPLAVLATAMAVAALPLCMILAAGLLPTVVAAVVDRLPGRYLARTVGPANLAGTALPVLTLFRTDFSISGGLHVLMDPHNWLFMYGAAAIGWGLHWALPQIAHVMLDMIAARTDQRLRRRADQLVGDWGAEVSGDRTAQPPR